MSYQINVVHGENGKEFTEGMEEEVAAQRREDLRLSRIKTESTC